jgi:4-amino-4-deoxy-L-arabinose transferase-like glycosyltransferase
MMPPHDHATELTAAVGTPRAKPGRLDGALLVMVFTALVVLPPVGHHLVAKSDEARFVLLARDMLERGAWFTAEVEGQQYRNKPPLFPWTIALLSRVRGAVTEGTAQLPAAVAAIAAALFTFLLGDRLFGRRAGLWAALMLATSANFFIHSQLVLPDMLVLAFTTLASYAFWRAASEPGNRRALVGFHAALAFAVFAKGPVGLLPVLVAAAWLVAEHGPRGLARLWSPGGIAVFVVVTLAWLGPFLASGSQSFGESVVWEDWLAWYLAWPAPRRILAFLGDALVGFLPWTLLLFLALGPAIRARRDPAVRFALLSFALPLLVIVLSRARLVRYLLPIYPAAALLTGWWADTRGAERTTLGRLVGWTALSAAVAAAALFPLVSTIEGIGIPQDPALARKALPALAGGLLLGLVFLFGLRDGRPGLLVRGGVLVMAVLLGYGAWLVNGWTEQTEDFRVVVRTLRRHAPDGQILVFTEAKLLPMDFYFGRELPRTLTVDGLRAYLARTDRPTVLIDEQDLRVTPRELAQDLRVLDTLRIHEQSLYILGCSGRERAAGSPRCIGREPPRHCDGCVAPASVVPEPEFAAAGSVSASGPRLLRLTCVEPGGAARG